jgi:hypothetical protein
MAELSDRDFTTPTMKTSQQTVTHTIETNLKSLSEEIKGIYFKNGNFRTEKMQ